MIQLISPINNAEISVLGEWQRPYALGLGEASAGKDGDNSIPAPVIFTYEPPVSAELTLVSSDGREKKYEVSDGRAEVYNLLVGEEYEWYVSSGLMRSQTYRFRTEGGTPRMLYVDGLSNVRDVGGFEALGGKRVRQGMVIRATEPRGVTNVTERGRATLKNELRICTDLDLRGINGEEVSDSLGDIGARFVNIPLAAYGDIFTESQKCAYKESFELLADVNNYPIMAHCQCGMDRTGTWIYVLGALLGVDEGDLVLDYEMSSLSRWGERSRESEDFKVFLEKFHAYGASARVAAESFLADCGVSASTVEKIRDILLEH